MPKVKKGGKTFKFPYSPEGKAEAAAMAKGMKPMAKAMKAKMKAKKPKAKK